MTKADFRHGETLSPELLGQVDAVCLSFEAAWKSGQRPQIEDHLPAVPEEARPELLRELLDLEVDYRRLHGDQPTAEEYLVRFRAWLSDFPGLQDWIRRLGSIPTPPLETPPPRPAPATDERRTPSFVPPEPDGQVPSVNSNQPAWPSIPGLEILEKLPGGGMGVVYRARQLNLNRVIALKMIRSGELAESQELARFQLEAEAVAQLDHPNIVRIYDFGEWNGRPYFSMEFAEGGTLARKLGDGPLPIREAVGLLKTLAQAMHLVHQRQIIHRDLKPGNVLFTADGTPKIADFGLAKRLDLGHRATQSGVPMGTASYMATEQAAGKPREMGPATDVYGLGAILYEALTGKPPFLAETPALTIIQVLFDEVVPPSHLRPEVPAELESICLKCLEKEPARRYPSALALADELQRFLDGLPITTPPSDWEGRERWTERVGYERLDLIGCSVVGMVYKARQVSLDRVVTLKTISARVQTEPAKMARFRAEAQAVARLQHPNIVQVYDYGEYQSRPFFSMEFLEGGTLTEKCSGSPLPVRRAVELIETLARAADYAHRQGIVHTDLRPSNVLLTAAGMPKITGFGLARLLELESPIRASKGTPLGLSNYMAPEQVDDRTGAVGPATDVHALGAMLYELLTGQPPFLADTVEETLAQICSRVPGPPSQLQPTVPAHLDAICQRCLHKEPGQRYPSAAEMAKDLRLFLNSALADTGEMEVIPGYELLEKLGRGGTGTVYKARQVRLDRLVALKLFRDHRARYLAANQAAARLQHPNIVQVYDCGERKGLLYVAEELIDGGTLAEKIAGQPQPPHEAAHLAESLARAMHCVHQQGIIHRNLKPRVVLLTSLDIPKIGSFDLAKLHDSEPDEAEAEGRQLIGTPIYMAPEQAAGITRDVHPMTDIYALGMILYEMLTGRPPFRAETVPDLLEQIRAQEPVPPSRMQPLLSPDLDAICLKCLAKEPTQRYANALDLANDLQRYQEGKPVKARPINLWQRGLKLVKRQFRTLTKPP